MRYGVLSLVLVVVFPVVASAGIGVGPQIGYYRADDADDGEFMFGLALRAKVIPALGVEGAINYRQEDYANDAVTVRSWPLTVTGLVYPFPSIYGAVGAGWYNTTFDYEGTLNQLGIEDDTHQEFGWHFGAGVELPLASNARLSGDVRYVFLDYDFEEVPGLGGQDSDFFVVAVGLFLGY